MKISVVVPIYNSEKYIGRCIDSILAQTYQNWELILVDDGSKDESLKILREYENKDSRIRVFHQENAGPGIARNTGIKYATGDYIVFVDSDDRIQDSYFEKLSSKTEDVVFIDINQVDEDFNILKTEHMYKYKKLSKDTFLRQQMTGRINWGGVRKAVKTELLTNNKIEYTEHKIGEEAIYSFLILYNAKTFSFINGPVYEYVNREGSQSDYQMDDPWGDVALALKAKLEELGLYKTYASTINAFIATAVIVSLDKMAGKYKYRDYLEQSRKRICEFRKTVDLEYPIDYRNISTKAMLLYPFVKIGWKTPIYIISALRRMVRR